PARVRMRFGLSSQPVHWTGCRRLKCMSSNLQTSPLLAHVPETLRPLVELAYNFWWTWSPGAADLFAWVNPKLWERVRHNPVKLLASADAGRLDELSQDPGFLQAAQYALRELGEHRAAGWGGWYAGAAGAVSQSRR